MDNLNAIAATGGVFAVEQSAGQTANPFRFGAQDTAPVRGAPVHPALDDIANLSANFKEFLHQINAGMFGQLSDQIADKAFVRDAAGQATLTNLLGSSR